jgi:SAM-dependent methyltransferase
MSTYTQGHHESVLRSHRWRTAENSGAYLLPHLSSGLRVLDVGCGPGTITADFARIVGASGAVLGTDRSAEVIDLARADHASNVGNLRFEVQDVMHLGLPDDSYDVVHAHQVLQHLQDPVAALREMARVTRPGGLIAVRDADYAAMVWHPADPALDRWLELYRTVARGNGCEPDAARHLLGWALQAGFQAPEASASAWCYATSEERQWWGGLQADRITASAVADQALGAGLTDRDGLDRMAAAWRRWMLEPDAWFAILNGEILYRLPD